LSVRPQQDDAAREECGIIGVFGVEKAAECAYAGLYALQHRGQESAGIVASDGQSIQSKKGLGLLSEAIRADELADLSGHIAVGHVRYSTTGAKRIQNIQPLVIEYSAGIIAIAHNGNLTNARTLRHLYQERGSIFQTSSDSEIIVHLLADPQHARADAPLSQVLRRVQGSFSLVILKQTELIAARDPHGFKPLSLGEFKGGWVVASETCAFDLLGARFVRDVEPGEIVSVDDGGLHSRRFAQPSEFESARCIFEYIYFARPDSIVFGETVHKVRLQLGANLALSQPADADIVVPVPDSGNSAALGFSRRSGIPLDSGFIRNHYVGRTFILPSEESRAGQVRRKLNVVRDVVAGKRIVVVDDSIVRGTTCRAQMQSLRHAGPAAIHLRISSPPIRFPCFYGIDFPSQRELIAGEKSVEQIRDFLGVDSLGYQTIEGLLDAVPPAPGHAGCPTRGYCTACFTGKYPVEVCENMDKHAFEQRPAKGRSGKKENVTLS
jgi:amidophosphoribosyltransferase